MGEGYRTLSEQKRKSGKGTSNRWRIQFENINDVNNFWRGMGNVSKWAGLICISKYSGTCDDEGEGEVLGAEVECGRGEDGFSSKIVSESLKQN